MTENKTYEITDEQLEAFRKEVRAIGFKILTAIQDGKDVFVNDYLIRAVGDMIVDEEESDPATGNPYGLKLFRPTTHTLEVVYFWPWLTTVVVREVVETEIISQPKSDD